MAIQINKGNRPSPQFRSTKHPELIEALDAMDEGDWIDFETPQDSKQTTIRNMIYRYTKVKWREHKAKVRVVSENGVERIYVQKLGQHPNGM